ncbi:MAG TPA: cytochrome c biogenesis protein CcsA [Clostridia bacterium]|nr:cytochrome c biogenesis protein CcsA [Clostridia bacterium]
MKPGIVIFGIVAAALLSYGLHAALVGAPTEQTMGDVQRIFYYHVPSAWTAFLLFFVNFVASIWYLVRRNPIADAIAVSAAEVGVVFCTVVLVTGPIWAKPVWGIWWTWDARLTSTLVLWLIYVSYLILRRYATGGQTQVMAAVLAIFGFLDVPLVYMAIRWFRTQHPQPVIGGGEGSGIHPSMMHALMWNFVAFLVFAGLVMWLRYRIELASRAIESEFAQRAVDDDLHGHMPVRSTR